MSQPIALQVREVLEAAASIEVRTPERSALITALARGGFDVHAGNDEPFSVLVGFEEADAPETLSVRSELRLIPGGVVWRDGALSEELVSAVALWAVEYFADHEVWLVNGSGSIAFVVDAETLQEQLRRRAAGQVVRDPGLPSNI